MKYLTIITLLVFIPGIAFAQSLSELDKMLDEQNEQRAKSLDPRYDYDTIDCPPGTYYGLDKQGTEICRDIKTNQEYVEPRIGDNRIDLTTKENEPILYGVVILFFIIMVIAVIAKSGKKSRSRPNQSGYDNSVRRGWNENEKLQVRQRQGGVCARCHNPPPRWEYHHRDGNRGNNSLRNCQGLCPNCHSQETFR